MKDHKTVFLNGRYVAWNEATVHLLSHSVSRGSAIFEVLSFYEGREGPSIFRLDAHVERLMRTADLLEMRLPLGEKEIARANRYDYSFSALASGETASCRGTSRSSATTGASLTRSSRRRRTWISRFLSSRRRWTRSISREGRKGGFPWASPHGGNSIPGRFPWRRRWPPII